MYNYNELNAVELSPSKKDYYQIWNELLDVAHKLSERWDPTATNESDPGIILLKVLTAIADKLSYSIDSSMLEAFMPSAAQEASMRKLCEMLGYNMKYYESAATSVNITYHGDTFPANGTIMVDKFTNIKDVDNTINYITLEDVKLSSTKRSQVVECLEGELVSCTTNSGNIITLDNLDDNYRYYLPEQQIASNPAGIFVANAGSQKYWNCVDNLNTQLLDSRVYKFGFDGAIQMPYLQFPSDISSLIGTGLTIQFLRTRGALGNISVNTLRTLEKPKSWDASSSTGSAIDSTSAADAVTGQSEAANLSEEWKSVDNYTVTNIVAATNGHDPESIDSAYWNYQKTIGTFDTLVTCRDYMNKIYLMTKSDANSTPLVSNIIVSDIRDDINRSYNLCTMSAQGLENKCLALSDNGKAKIDYFDLILYPFTTTYGLNTKGEFNSSFTYSNSNTWDITARLEESKTAAHKLVTELEASDIACIKVYFKLAARVNTNSKVSALEAAEVEDTLHRALFKNFNMRHMEFGEELPYDSILSVLETADSRVKNVSLDDPQLYISVCTVDGSEYPIVASDHIYSSKAEAEKAKEYYIKLVLRDVLAGKVALFNYDTDFGTALNESVYKVETLLSSSADAGTNQVAASLTDLNSIKALGNTNILCYSTAAKEKISINISLPSAPEGSTSNIKVQINDAQTIAFEGIDSNAFADIDAFWVYLYRPAAAWPSYLIEYGVTTGTESTRVAGATIETVTLKSTNCYEVDIEQLIADGGKNSIFEVDSSSPPVYKYLDVLEDDVLVSNRTIEAIDDTQDLSLFNIHLNGLTYLVEDGDTVTTLALIDKVAIGVQRSAAKSGAEPVASIYFSASEEDEPVEDPIEDPEVTAVKNLSMPIRLSEGDLYLTVTDPTDLDQLDTLTLDTSDNVYQGLKVNSGLPKVTKVTSDFKINLDRVTEDSPLVLANNEVVQFRAPNFKTKMTYPAYVNYYLKLNPNIGNRGSGTRNAIPATFYSLLDFFSGSLNQAGVYTDISGWNSTISWEEKFNSLPAALIGSYTTKANSGNWTIPFTGNGSTAEAEDNKTITELSNKWHKLFTKTNDEYKIFKPEGTIQNNLEIYHLNITENNFELFIQWLRGIVGAEDETKITYRYDTSDKISPAGEIIGKTGLIQNVYTRSSQNSSRQPGFLVDSAHRQYKVASELSWLKKDDILNEYFVPRLWYQDSDADGCSKNGLGANPLYTTIKAGTEYRLCEDEYLLFTYSSSEGREDGTTVVKNVGLGPGSIIKANFELVDSESKSYLSSYNKTSDFGPWKLMSLRSDGSTYQSGVVEANAIDGMFTLGATDQIEQREPIIVPLDNTITKLYWELKSKKISGSYEYFPFDADGRYTLKAGEYLFFTTDAEESFAYYGSGTEVRRGTKTPAIRRPVKQQKLSTKEINELGLVSSIPWVTVNLSGDNAAVTLQEYQYVNLAVGDTLFGISMSPEVGSENPRGNLTNTYRRVYGADYIISGIQGSLPTLAVDDYYWEARGKLELDLNSSKPQLLTVHKNSAGLEVARDFVYLWGNLREASGTISNVENITQVYTVLPTAGMLSYPTTNSTDKLALYTNVDIVTAAGDYQLITVDDNGKVAEKSLTVKACLQRDLTYANKNVFAQTNDLASMSAINLHSGAGDDIASESRVTSFNLLVPNNEYFGLLAFYYVPYRAAGSTYVKITAEAENQQASTTPSLSIYNLEGDNGWWETDTLVNPGNFGEKDEDNNYYFLRKGLNIIKLTKSCKLNIYAPQNSLDTLYVGNLKLIPSANSLNKKLAFTGDQAVVFKYKNGTDATTNNELRGFAIESVTDITTTKKGCWEFAISGSAHTKSSFDKTAGSITRLEGTATNTTAVTYLPPGTLVSVCLQNVWHDLVVISASGSTITVRVTPEFETDYYNLEDHIIDNSISDNFCLYNKDMPDKGLFALNKAKQIGRTTDNVTISESEILSKIRTLDSQHEFYYTVDVSNESGLDLNELDPYDTLAVPKNWFDSQSTNNKFVVSEIDTDYLSDHVIVSKFSRGKS